ncbi:MAG: hypothetical protein RLP15_10530 [Cryomorphaceae bacterium]
MKLLIKITWLTALLFLINLLYPRFAFEAFLAEHADQYLQVQKIKNCDVIYLSASSNFASGLPTEKDPRKLSQFVADHFPKLRFEAINQPASHAGIHADILEMFRADAEAKTFIVTMNLRSFGPDWIHSELETPLRQAAVFYNNRPPLLNRLLASFRAYDDRSTEERHVLRREAWDNQALPFDAPRNNVTDWCAVEKWGDWRDPKRQLADQFIKQYAFVLNEENPRVKDFDRIAKMAEEEAWTVVFNILAENVETADSLVGKDLTSLMRRNTEWLVARYESIGFVVVNNLESVSHEHFTDKDFPTEHYDDVGRKIIAKNVAVGLSIAMANRRAHDH